VEDEVSDDQPRTFDYGNDSAGEPWPVRDLGPLWRDGDDVIIASGGFCAPMAPMYSLWLGSGGWPVRFHLFPRLDRLRDAWWEIRIRVETAVDVLRGRHDCDDGDGW
jgi:hypothetical protein